MGRAFQFVWEVVLIEYIQAFILKWPVLVDFFRVVTLLGEEVVAVLILGTIYWGYDKKWGSYSILYLLFGQLSNNMIKNIFQRLRPYFVNESIQCLKPPAKTGDLYDPIVQGFSFPSGHTTCITSIMTCFWLKLKDRKVFFYLLPIVLLVGTSRFALGVHYPTDVLMGLVLGFFGILLIDLGYRKMRKEHLYLALLILSLAGMSFCRSEDYFAVAGIFIGFMVGDLIEERYIHFENTRRIPMIIARVLLGGILTLAIVELLKLPVQNLADGSMAALLYRSFRYAFASAIAFGFYPYLFKYKFLK